MMNSKLWGASALTLSAALFAAQAQAADATSASASAADSATADATTIDAVIVTGTRQTGVRAVDSAAPVQVVDSGALTRTGQSDLRLALSNLTPSFSAQAFGGDAANLTLSARLRGTSANQTLVLINGKRRHTTANLAVLAGAYQGSAAADLNFIPVAGISRVEVLTDGAAAQYGTDAIAGVINIILKDDNHGGEVSGAGGAYYERDGETSSLSANIGLAPSDNSYINLTFENRFHDFSFRGGPDARIIGSSVVAANPTWPTIIQDYPYVNRIAGDARVQLNVGSFSAGVRPNETLEVYSFGTYGRKKATAYENYRLPNRIPTVYPAGFSPRLETLEKDLALTGGVKGQAFGWNFDLSSTYGKDDHQIRVRNSANLQLFADTGSTPTQFHAGDFISTQWTNNLDVSREFAVGWATPLNVAFGLEQRDESYEIKAGDPASRYKSGSQSYPGFALTDAGKHDRDSWAAYVDLAASPIENLQLDLAGRHEHFSDFGSTDIVKLTGRYDFTPAFALRGTASTGFRAPTLAELNYSATNVSPTTAFVQLAPNSAGARLLGLDGLDPEKSKNLSIGIVAEPIDRVTLTIDAYQIKIEDRIVGSGALYGKIGGAVVNAAITNAIAANGNTLDPSVGTTGINLFTNGLDTRTRGIEILASTWTNLGEHGKIDWTLGANINTTKVTRIAAPPTGLAGSALFDQTAIANLEHASPRYKVGLTSLYSSGKWTVNLVNTVYGPAWSYTNVNGAFFKDKIKTSLITDLEFAYKITPSLRAAWGANNLFDVYPDKLNPAGTTASIAAGNPGVALYPSFSAFGINGGYYYGRLTYSF
jgi:iron complex outermembrane receptor protein